MFDTVLVANRGEIAARIIGTLRRMGIESVAVYTEADADAPFVRLADRAVCLGSAQGYLDVDAVVEAARATGCQALHPGYGFLSENPALARACADAGIAFIGPPVEILETMGDKISAKGTAIAAGVPVVPGRHDAGMDDDALAQAIRDVGLPALLKPSAGGGGKGMVIVRGEADIAEAISSARRVARSAFGDDTLLVERYVERPRHIEVQILADQHGHVVHLGERECSLQRRHQKVIEESPSPFLDEAVRARLCASAVRLAREVGYVGAGTVEYVVAGDDPESFAFLEMNARLQVEHPVTEAVTFLEGSGHGDGRGGLDLVEWQMRIAAGESLDFDQDDVRRDGHAVEARIYAEDPATGFLPTGGRLLAWAVSPMVRSDAGVATGTVVGSAYDPMLAKVIAQGDTRAEAIAVLRQALDGTVALGVTTNIAFLGDLLDDPAVIEGDLDTTLVDRFAARWSPPVRDVRMLAALASRPVRSDDPFHQGDSWRLGGPAPLRLDVDGEDIEVPRDAELPADVTAVRDGEWLWLHAPGLGNRRAHVTRPIDRRLRSHASGDANRESLARSPMPGSVVSVAVVEGDRVAEGDVLAVVEAMKMEHAVRAAAPGVVRTVHVAVGDQVRLDEALVAVDHPEE
ncbi:MAG: acetyl/propionyl/methylcrotonyl-CoA carboxylase subunit alpha [Candidatus Nanopelagicales bacterium]